MSDLTTEELTFGLFDEIKNADPNLNPPDCPIREGEVRYGTVVDEFIRKVWSLGMSYEDRAIQTAREMIQKGKLDNELELGLLEKKSAVLRTLFWFLVCTKYPVYNGNKTRGVRADWVLIEY